MFGCRGGVEMRASNSASSFASETWVLSFAFGHCGGVETQASNSVPSFSCEMRASSSVSDTDVVLRFRI